MTHIRGLITQLITTPEPPSRPYTLYPYRIPMDPLKGTLKGTLITNPEPPSNPLCTWTCCLSRVPAAEELLVLAEGPHHQVAGLHTIHG